MPDVQNISAETGSYSWPMGMMFLFNLIVGTGALTMPKAFGIAGWLLSLIVVCLIAIFGYISATFVIEAMASANALRRWDRIQHQQQMSELSEKQDGQPDEHQDDDEQRPLLSPSLTDTTSTLLSASDPKLFAITETTEIGCMASMFFSKLGVQVFYLCVIVYLYGDLAIYAVAVPKSLRDVVCTFRGSSHNDTVIKNCVTNLTEADQCWSFSSLTRINVYRIFVALFAVVIGPFVFMNLQKTKYLQVLTSLLRWTAFITMISLAIIRLADGQGNGHPPVANVAGVPNLFGACVYSFMCHHSLPQLILPIGNKSRLSLLLFIDYLVILAFYILLSFTGIFGFRHLYDLYTLNFQPDSCDHRGRPVTGLVFVQYFLALYPLYTLSTSFPIIGITLRNNLKILFARTNSSYPWTVDRVFFPVVTLLLPFAIALATNNIQVLVGVTGSYAGAGIQYVIPAALVLMSRRCVVDDIGADANNRHRSPFKQMFWAVVIFVWAAVCIIFVTVNYIISFL